MKTFRNIMIGLVCLVLIAIIVLFIIYKKNLSPVDKNDTTIITVEIPEKSTSKEIGKILEEKEVIRSSTFFNIYVRLFKPGEMKASTYELSKSMSFEEIIDILVKGNSYNKEQISITFKEGYNIRQIAEQIEKYTINKYDDVIALSRDKEYIDELIEKYWFITDDIKNDNLYYNLEGYLFPDTYFFSSKNVSIKEIFTKMLNETDKKLSKYKDTLEEKKVSVHYILTLASLIEKEGKTIDFEDISSVFYNRIDKNMKFESCASAIYGIKKEFSDYTGNRAITDVEMKDNNPYNTYLVQIPIGPICSPSIDAIVAAINPKDSNNLFFLSDITGKTYFFESYSEQQSKKQELIKAGKWN